MGEQEAIAIREQALAARVRRAHPGRERDPRQPLVCVLIGGQRGQRGVGRNQCVAECLRHAQPRPVAARARHRQPAGRHDHPFGRECLPRFQPHQPAVARSFDLVCSRVEPQRDTSGLSGAQQGVQHRGRAVGEGKQFATFLLERQGHGQVILEELAHLHQRPGREDLPHRVRGAVRMEVRRRDARRQDIAPPAAADEDLLTWLAGGFQ